MSEPESHYGSSDLHPKAAPRFTPKFQFLCLFLVSVFYSQPTSVVAFTSNNNPFDKIRDDFLALTRKSTTRHILLPKSVKSSSSGGYDAALLLKQKIRNKVTGEGAFIVDVFSSAARRFSIDKETAEKGGLLGEMLPQGYCVCPELDRACFEAPLGEVSGPIESQYGYHLVLVCERINCPRLDGTYTRVISGEGGKGTVLAPSTDGNQKSVEQQVVEASIQQVGFWLAVFLAGGALAEISAKASGILDTLPWE